MKTKKPKTEAKKALVSPTRKKLHCCLCSSTDIERVTADGSPLCKHHQRLVDDVVKLADSKRKAHA